MVMIDTDIIIWIVRGNPSTKAQFDQIVGNFQGRIFVTPIHLAEIYAGIRESEQPRTQAFFDAVRTIEIQEEMGKQAGEYINTYGKSHGVTLTDAVIAAASVNRKCRLWTLNVKHYPMLERHQFLSV